MAEVTRREFVTVGGAVIALGALARDSWARAAERSLGIQLYTVAADLNGNVAGTLKGLSGFGYKCVESAGFAKLSAGDFRKLLDEAGLQCPSCHLGFTAADPAPLFDDAHAVGARYAVSSVLLPAERAGADFMKVLGELTAEDFKKIAALANTIGARARKAGLQYAYHNHNFEFRDLGGGETGYAILLRETDPDAVKFQLDCGWAVAAGQKPVELFKKHPGRFRMLHVKDFVLKDKPTYALFGPDRPTGTELGKGQIDYKSIFAAAQAVGVEYFFSEQEPPITNMKPLEAAKANFDYMRGL